MNTTTPTTIPAADSTVDGDRLMAFVFRAVGEIGATLNTALVVMGDRLGYYRALAGAGPTTPAELAARTCTDAHYTREWLNAQAAGGFVDYDPTTGGYTLPAEHAVALADESSPAFLPGFFQLAHGAANAAADIIEAARTGGGRGWHEHNTDVHLGCERFFRSGYTAHLVAEWLPALDGVTAKLTAGATVADVGCGHGASTILMAQAYPRSRFVGSDYHRESIDIARTRAADAGVADRVRFEVAEASTYTAATMTWSRCSTPSTTWATRSGRPATSTTPSLPTGPGWSSSRRPGTGLRTTSTRSAASTTASPRWSAPPRRSRSPSGWRWAPRQAPPGSAR
jgi:Methyltransferase domain